MIDKLAQFKPPLRDKSNRHVVDRLADIRDKIAYFKGIENSLKEAVCELMGEGGSVGGDEYIATKTVSQRAGSVDVKRLEADGIEVEKYRKPASTTTSIRLEERR